MNALLSAVLSNCLLAFVLVAAVWAITRSWRDPFLAHALWLLVLVKLVTPPLVHIPLPYKAISGNQAATGNQAVTTVVTQPEFDSAAAPKPPILPRSILPQAILPEPIGTKSTVPESTVPESTVPESTVPEKPAWRPSEDLGGIESGNPVPLSPPESIDGPSVSRSLATGLMLVWLTGVVWLVFIGLRRHRRMLRVFAAATAPDDQLRAEAKTVGKQLGLKNLPEIRVTDVRVSPLVALVGWRPTVLLPGELFRVLSRSERLSILAHEFAHLQRGDHLVRGFELFVLVVYWWNPVAWWVSCRLRQAEEECCDSCVVNSLPNSRSIYGGALLQAVEFVTEEAAVADLAASPFVQFGWSSSHWSSSPFKRRIEMIMLEEKGQKIRWSAAAVVGVLALLVLPVAAQTVAEDERAEGGSQPGKERVPGELRKSAEARSTKPGSARDDSSAKQQPSAEPARKAGTTSKVNRWLRCTLRPVNDLVVSARSDGVIESVSVTIGTRVKKGSRLAQMDDTDAQFALERAILEHQEAKPNQSDLAKVQVEASSAVARLEQSRKLHEKAMVSLKQVKSDEVQADLAKLRVTEAERKLQLAELRHRFLKSAVTVAERHLENCTVVSPIDGVVIEVHHQAGESVRPGDPLFRVMNLRELHAEGFVEGPADGHLAGRNVRVEVQSKSGKTRTIDGKVIFVSPGVDPANGLSRILVHLSNVDQKGEPISAPGLVAHVALPGT